MVRPSGALALLALLVCAGCKGRPSGTEAAALGARSEPFVEPGRAGGRVRTWFARGQLGSAPGIEDCRRTGGRC